MIWLWINNEVPKHRPSHVYRGLPIIHFEDQTSFGPANLTTIWPKLGHTNTDGSLKICRERLGLWGADFHLKPGKSFYSLLANISGIWMLEEDFLRIIKKMSAGLVEWNNQRPWHFLFFLDWRRGLDYIGLLGRFMKHNTICIYIYIWYSPPWPHPHPPPKGYGSHICRGTDDVAPQPDAPPPPCGWVGGESYHLQPCIGITICLYWFMYVWLYVCLSVCLSVCLYVCMYVCTQGRYVIFIVYANKDTTYTHNVAAPPLWVGWVGVTCMLEYASPSVHDGCNM